MAARHSQLPFPVLTANELLVEKADGFAYASPHDSRADLWIVSAQHEFQEFSSLGHSRRPRAIDRMRCESVLMIWPTTIAICGLVASNFRCPWIWFEVHTSSSSRKAIYSAVAARIAILRAAAAPFFDVCRYTALNASAIKRVSADVPLSPTRISKETPSRSRARMLCSASRRSAGAISRRDHNGNHLCLSDHG